MVEDGPTNNFCTLNPADVDSALVLSEGALQGTNTTSAQWEQVGSTFIVPKTGKWYWESCIKQDKAHLMLFFDRSSEALNGDEVANLYVWDFQSASNNIRYNTTAVASSDVAQGDVASVSVTDGVVKFYKNNVLAHTFTQNMSLDSKDYVVGLSAHSTSSGGQVCLNFGQDSSFAGYKNDNTNPQTDANGKGDFYYAPPADHLALCTDNLDDPSIADPTDHFNTVAYTGNGAAGHAITGVGFQPDFTWLKKRGGGTAYSHQLYDVVRGATNYLTSNTTAAENDGGGSFANGLASWQSDGFTIGNTVTINDNGVANVSWNWKAGGTAVSNTDGSITSSVSANPTAGFSVLTYTGNETAGATVGHGLSQAPELVINKVRGSATQWYVNATAVSDTSNKVLMLNATDPLDSGTLYFNDTDPTATLITLGSYGNLNSSGSNVIYCWHSVDGYSKVGSYTGNGSADGSFIYTGFKPAYTLVKRSDASGQDWRIIDSARDTYNVASHRLWANESTAEDATDTFGDFLSNGFKVRTTSGGWNASGGTYIYLAFAESPFKTSNAR
jgi:hypothetical protein